MNKFYRSMQRSTVHNCWSTSFPILLLVFVLFHGAIAHDLKQPSRIETEQLLQYYRSQKDPTQKNTIPSSLLDGKCRFGINAQIADRWKEFSPGQQAEFATFMQVDTMQYNITSGHFRIYYDATGTNEPALLNSNKQRIPGTAIAYLNAVAEIFNHVWDVEINQMGYTPPPFEVGHSYYNISVKNLSGYYGETKFIIPPYDGVRKYLSYIEVDNDYQGFATFGINGLEVTAAHEFQHAIQIGSYGFWGDTLRYAHELTSTWFEDVVYPEVNDYFYYLPTYFDTFYYGISLNAYIIGVGGYERCIWAHFLAKRFSPNVMKDVWTTMENQTFPAGTDVFLISTDLALPNYGSNLQEAFAEFTHWNYFTADRADVQAYYPEGDRYPRFLPLKSTIFDNTTSTQIGDVQPLSSSMYEFTMTNDTVMIMVANIDDEAAQRRLSTGSQVSVTLSSQPLSPPYQQIKNGLYTQISVAVDSLWRYFYSKEIAWYSNASPNPFRLNEANHLLLPVNEDRSGTADVYFYSPSLSLVYSGRHDVINRFNTRVIEVPTSRVVSSLATGVYFVIAKTKNSEYKWKVAVIR